MYFVQVPLTTLQITKFSSFTMVHNQETPRSLYSSACSGSISFYHIPYTLSSMFLPNYISFIFVLYSLQRALWSTLYHFFHESDLTREMLSFLHVILLLTVERTGVIIFLLLWLWLFMIGTLQKLPNFSAYLKHLNNQFSF